MGCIMQSEHTHASTATHRASLLSSCKTLSSGSRAGNNLVWITHFTFTSCILALSTEGAQCGLPKPRDNGSYT